MIKSNSAMAQQIAQAASAFEKMRTGRAPGSVTVVLSDNTLVITLHGALSPAEKALAQTPDGAAQMQEFVQELFANSSEEFRQEIKRITGVEVREAVVEVEPATGTVVKAFTSGTVVQVYLLAQIVPSDSWSGNGSGDTHESHRSISGNNHEEQPEISLPGKVSSSKRTRPVSLKDEE